jgi:hypothetical protein
MESIRTVNIQELRSRVARAEYVVDTQAVAEAIVRRALGASGDGRSRMTSLRFEADGDTGGSPPTTA